MATATIGARIETPDVPDWVGIVDRLGPAFAARAAEADACDRFVMENYAELKAARLFSAGVPRELGGGGADYAELAAMLRRLAHHCGSTALALAMHTHQIAVNSWRWRHEQAPVDALLRKVAAEELVLLTSGGSDWLASSGEAVRVEGGYRVSGRKAFASGMPAAGLFSTSAVLDDPEEGPLVLHFGLPLGASGVQRIDNWRALGMRGTASGEVLLENVFVPEAAIGVRRPRGRWHRLFHLITMRALPLIYAVYVGVAEAGCHKALGLAKGRRATDPHLPYLVGEMENAVLAAQLALEDMVRLGGSGEPCPATTSRVCQARTLAGRGALLALERAMEVAGGAAFQRANELERLFRDVQGARFHPLQEKAQTWLTGRLALGLDIDP
jgi:acyl-CoA dehydrogenase